MWGPQEKRVRDSAWKRGTGYPADGGVRAPAQDAVPDLRAAQGWAEGTCGNRGQGPAKASWLGSRFSGRRTDQKREGVWRPAGVERARPCLGPGVAAALRDLQTRISGWTPTSCVMTDTIPSRGNAIIGLATPGVGFQRETH